MVQASCVVFVEYFDENGRCYDIDESFSQNRWKYVIILIACRWK